MMTIVNSVMQTKVDLIREGQILHLFEETPVLHSKHTKLSERPASRFEKLSFRSLQVFFESLHTSTAPNPFIELFDSSRSIKKTESTDPWSSPLLQ
jgi:hypothetical protein